MTDYTPPFPESNIPTPPPAANNTSSIIAMMLTAIIFFFIGSLLTYLFFGGDSSDAAPVVDGDVQAAVEATFFALTPTATAEPTRVPAELTYLDTNPYMGPVDAPITLVEFSDYLCPYCSRFHIDTLDALMAHYDGLVKFVYREYPIIGQQATADIGAAAQCANLQGKYWEFTDLVWANQASADRVAIDTNVLASYAETVGLDIEAYNTCIADGTGFNMVVADFEDGRDFFINATPGFFVEGTRFTLGAVPIEMFMDIIDAELLEKGITPPARPTS